MQKPSPPAAPDYVGAAQAQGQANIDANKQNNPNVIGPTGSNVYYSSTNDPTAYRSGLQKQLTDAQTGMLDWNTPVNTGWRAQFNDNQPNGSERAGAYFTAQNAKNTKTVQDAQQALDQFNRTGLVPSDTSRPTLVQQLSPEQQGLYDQQTKNQGLLGGLASQGINAAQGILGRRVDYSGAPAMPGSSDAIRQKVYAAMMQRPNEDIAVQRDNMNSQLTAAGIPKDSLAYQNATRQIDRQENDARNQAVLSGGAEAQRNYGMDLQSRQQGLNEQNAQRSIPLNEITALMSGSQVSNPFQMPQYNGNVQAAPIYNAANHAAEYGTDVYNQQAAQRGNTQSGLIGLGGTALMAGAAFM